MIRRAGPIVFIWLVGMLGVTATGAQEVPAAPAPEQHQARGGEGREDGPRPLFGRITALKDGALEITGRDGQVVTVKLTAQTVFRKDREPAKAADFKVGDMVMVRGDENADHSVTAKLVGARNGGPGGPGAGPGSMGTLGKDYVVGEVKEINPPSLTILRVDNVSQTIELNEDSSLRKGRESITMADVQVGDHVMARGAVQKEGVFVPKEVMVMGPEQWKRAQEFMAQSGATKPGGPETPAPKP